MTKPRSKIFSASAGTGKTYQLTQRYVRLIESGVPASKVLAITFTKKAAKEMKERILASIEVDDLRVQTIDSLFHEWMREFPFESNLRFDFEKSSQLFPLDWTLGSPQDFISLKERAFDQILDQIPPKTFDLDIFQIKSALFRMSRYDLNFWLNKQQGLHGFQKFFEEKRSLEEIEKNLFSTVKKVFPDADELKNYVTADGKKISSKKFTKKIREGHPAEDEYLQNLLNERKIRILDQKGEFLFLLYEKFRNVYEKFKYQNQILEFSDLTLGAYRIFFHPEAQGAAAQICRKYQHILIDEFQDTSLIQWKIFEKLIEELISGVNLSHETSDQPGTFFVVGDVKQSIYGFREADPSIMLELPQIFPQEQFDYMEMDLNRRSSSLVIDFVNATFTDKMTGFRKHNAHTEKPNIFPSSTVEVVDEFEELEKQGEFISDKITRIKKDHPTLRFSDIAILYRSQLHLEEVLLSLRKNKIPYFFLDDTQMYENQILFDLFSALKYFVRPDDQLSYLSILKSGFVSENTLSKLKPMFLTKSLHSFLIQLVKEAKWCDDTVDYFLAVAATYERNGKNAYQMIADFESKILHQNFAPSAIHPDSVQLMTIHKSKGLEFECVFLVNTSQRWARDERMFFKQRDHECDRIYFIGNQSDQPHENPMFEEVATGLRKELWEESLRLMYVALTRAKNFLFVTATRNESRGIESTNLYEMLPKFSKTEKNLNVESENFGEKTISLPKIEMRNKFEYKVLQPSRLMSEGDQTLFEGIPGHSSLRCSLGMTIDSNEPSSLISVIPSEPSGERLGISLGVSPSELGTQIHLALENYFSNKPNSFTGPMEKFFEKLISSEPIQFIRRFIGNKYIEKSFCLLDGEKMYQGRIDLVMESKEILVIDYKVLTHEISNDQLIQKYSPQIRVYEDLLRGVYPYKTISSYLLAIRMNHNHELIRVK